MTFPLEAIVTVSPDQVGPKIKEYVRTIHERYVVIVDETRRLRLTQLSREAYKTVQFHDFY
jgi:hypothetical protein